MFILNHITILGAGICALCCCCCLCCYCIFCAGKKRDKDEKEEEEEETAGEGTIELAPEGPGLTGTIFFFYSSQ